MTGGEGFAKVGPPAIGFGLGALFIYALDKFTPHLHINFNKDEAEGPEDELASDHFACAGHHLAQHPRRIGGWGFVWGRGTLGLDGATTAGAVALAIGIGIQNFPEGLSVSMPTAARRRVSWQSVVVRPVVGHRGACGRRIGAVAVMAMRPILPYALAFAAGAMIYVVVEEVIPETQRDKYTDVATLGFIGGFIVMMSLDVGLG